LKAKTYLKQENVNYKSVQDIYFVSKSAISWNFR